MRIDWRRDLVAVALFALVCLAFLPAFRCGFVSYDDDLTVYRSPEVVQGLSLAGVRWAFTHSVLGVWDPLTTLSHQADCQWFGLQPWGHHAVNVALHGLCAVLLFFALSRMTGALWPSALAAAFFALHPLRVESVAWVTERKDVLSGLFFVLALWIYAGYARRPGVGRYLLLALAFVLGLLAKSMVLTLPFVLLLLDFWPLGRWQTRADGWRLLREKLPLFALSILAAVTQIIAARDVIQPIDQLPLTARLANALHSYAAYLGQTFWPARLGAYYPHPGASLPWWQPVGALALLLAITAVALLRRRAQPYLLIGWLWFLGTLVPVIGIVQSGLLAHADRYTYLPSIGLAIMLSWAMAGLAAKGRGSRLTVGVAATAALAACGALTWQQAATWGDTEQLFRQAIRATGRNPLAHLNLGIALWAKGANQEGLDEMHEAVLESPTYGEAHLNLGTVLATAGFHEDALEELRQAVALLPDSPEAQHALGLCYEHSGRRMEAIVPMREALRLDPETGSRWIDLGVILRAGGKKSEATEIFRQASQKFPALADAHQNLGSVLFEAQQYPESEAEFKAALRLQPGSAGAHNGLGSTLFMAGKLEEAKGEYERALALEPGNVDARRNLGGLLQAIQAQAAGAAK